MHSRKTRGFTLVELIISVALIAVAISVFVQTSGPFRDRLALISKRTETNIALMRLAVYLHDLHGISDNVSIDRASDKIVFEKAGSALARCGADASKSSIVCIFLSHSEAPVPIFSLADNGFNQVAWSTSTINGVTVHSLILMKPSLRSSASPSQPGAIHTHVDFGIMPSVHEIFPP